MLPPEFREAIDDLYRQLGGVLAEPRLRPGGWDLALEDGLLIELDEQFHFTRYRAQTLAVPFARNLPWAKPYAEYVQLHEVAAVAPGNRWANASSDRMFGGSDAVGQHHLLGGSRWKQRALYDAIKDASAACGLVRLSRVAIYDEVGGVGLDRALYGRATIDIGLLADLVHRRATA